MSDIFLIQLSYGTVMALMGSSAHDETNGGCVPACAPMLMTGHLTLFLTCFSVIFNRF